MPGEPWARDWIPGRGSWVQSQVPTSSWPPKLQTNAGVGADHRLLSIPRPSQTEIRKPTHPHWFVSAPGKVILFGEHAVVHGVVSCRLLLLLTVSDAAFQTAIGASVDLRCYALASHRNDNRISLHLPDLNDWQHEWNIDSLPWSAVTPTRIGEDHGPYLDQRLMDAIAREALPESVNEEKYLRAKAAVTAFLYLYMCLSMDGGPKYVSSPLLHYNLNWY